MTGGVLALQIIRHVNTLDLVRLITVKITMAKFLRKPDDEMAQGRDAVTKKNDM